MSKLSKIPTKACDSALDASGTAELRESALSKLTVAAGFDGVAPAGSRPVMQYKYYNYKKQGKHPEGATELGWWLLRRCIRQTGIRKGHRSPLQNVNN
jgi:hypothetical protein